MAETRWHASQRLEPQPDGSLLWRAQVAGPHEVLVWILGWGGDAEVLEPPELRAARGRGAAASGGPVRRREADAGTPPAESWRGRRPR